MQSLSTSLVSLRIRGDTYRDDIETPSKTKLSDSKPSFIYFLALFYAFLSMGLGGGLIGPTLLKLGEHTQAPLDRVVYIFVTRSVGFLIGTLLGGVLVDYFTRFGRTFLTLAILIMCLCTLSIPFIYYFIPLIAVQFMWGISAGMVDNLAQILTLRHYSQQQVSPYLQALHGAFGVGALLAPLFVAPLLSKTSPTDRWRYAYWLIGLLHVPNFIWILIYALRDECCLAKTVVVEINAENDQFVQDEKPAVPNAIVDDVKETPKSSKAIIVTVVIALFLLLYVGGESAFGSYIHTYAIFHLKFAKDIAAYLNAAFWASFAFGRLCGIPLSILLSPLQMITIDLFGCIGSIIFILILNKSPIVLWIGSILFGLFVASIYASTIAYIETHFPLTGKRISMLALGGSAGDALIPLLIGYSITSTWTGSLGFIIILLVVIIMASVLFGLVVFCLGRQSIVNEK